MCGPTLVCMHRDCARGGRDGQLREASRDGRQESLDNSPGQASRRVPGPVEALRRTLPTNRAWKDFLNFGAMISKYQNYQNDSTPSEHYSPSTSGVSKTSSNNHLPSPGTDRTLQQEAASCPSHHAGLGEKKNETFFPSTFLHV